MGSGFIYSGQANTKKNVKRNRFVRSFLFVGMLLVGIPIVSKAAPAYVSSSPQTVQVCQNSTGVDISSYLTINDPNVGSTETWSVLGFGPLNGTVSPSSYANSSSGGTDAIAANSLIYTPNPGFAGTDTFTIQVSDGTNSANMFFIMSVNLPPSLVLGTVDTVCQGATSTTIAFSGLNAVGPTRQTFFSGNSSSWAVPAGVTSITFDALGGVGGNDSKGAVPAPGKGGRIQGTLAVTPGETLFVTVGSSGGNGTPLGAQGGYNGGGNAFYYSPIAGCGGGGGGASDIRIGGNGLANRVVVAGGGGGSGWDTPGDLYGGPGGNNTFGFGGSGDNNDGGSHANGGSQAGGGLPATYAGWLPGMAGGLGVGGNGSVQGISGAGGGGYYGGGGGVWTGGGGGSSYTGAGVTSVTNTQGYNNGEGQITFNYVIPGTYMIQWGGLAQSAGFPPTVVGTLPSSPITVAIPAGVAAGTYSGVLTISNPLCGSQPYFFSVVVNPVPDVSVVSGQAVCNGAAATGVTYTNATTYIPNTVFDWTSSNRTIGLEPNGFDSLPSFTAVNGSASPILDTIMVTPVASGCTGNSISFIVTVNPTPMLDPTRPNIPICSGTPFNYSASSLTTGTSLIWNATATPGTFIAEASGSNNPDDSITNFTTSAVQVPFVYSLAANGCTGTQTIMATVNASPVLNSPAPAPVCSGNTFNYTATTLTPGVSLAWSRVAVAGITPLTGTGSGNISETLTSSSPNPVTVQYVYTNTIIGTACSNTQNVNVIVNPTPVLNGYPLPPAPLCSGTDFNDTLFDPSSLTAGTTFAWSRALTTGIGNPANTGTGSPNEVLNNVTPYPVTVTYAYTLTANRCPNVENVMVTVNPTPRLSSLPLSFSVCDDTVVNYNPTSLTPGTTFTWQRNAITGITNPTFSNIGNPLETLNNITPLPIVDTYIYTLIANGCSNNQNVYVTVNPKPVLTTPLIAPTICDSTVFSYPASSATPGVSFEWYRPYVSGIYALADTGSTNNPDQKLINSTYVTVPVTYIYTLKINGCSNVQDVTVIVNPTPRLTSSLTGSVCSGSNFSYTPTSYTPGATYSWDRPATTGIAPNTNFGTGNVNETLTNSGLTPITVGYEYRLTIGSCPNLGYQTVEVAVNPTPPAPGISTTISPLTVCMNTLYQNFSAGSAPASNINYAWSATNAFVYETGSNNQNAIVNFNSAGNAVVTLTDNVIGYSCYNSSSITVNVEDNTPSVEPAVIYNNGQFICLQNNNQSYQWGYDNKLTLASTVLAGQINQNYDNSNPDFTDNRYWVITNTEGCILKAYYDQPPSNTGVTNIDGGAVVKIYPNPAANNINVEVITSATGNMQVEVLNVLGQRVASQPAVNNKANIDVESLPAGNYLVDCYLNGIKIANAKFTKN